MKENGIYTIYSSETQRFVIAKDGPFKNRAEQRVFMKRVRELRKMYKEKYR